MARVVPLSRLRAVLLLLVVAIAIGLLTSVTTRTVAAQLLADSTKIDDLQRAIAWDPRNPEFHFRLGMAELSGAAGDSATAMASLRRAIQLHPDRARYWLGLADGCAVVGDTVCAAQAYERATQLAPMRPSMEWEAATFYAAFGQKERSVSHLRRLLALDPSSADGVFQLTWRAYEDPAMVWKELVAPSTVRCAYLEFLGERKRFDLTAPYWAELIADTQRQLPTFAEVKPYLQLLLRAQQYEQAVAVWRDLLRQDVVPPGSDAERLAAVSSPLRTVSGNLLYNANFDRPILNAGFDWQTRQESYVVLELYARTMVGDAGRHGHAGLRIDFTVPHNSEHEPIYEFVPVTPGKRYLLRGLMRSEDITSDSGPRLRVVDPLRPQELDAATDGVTGTTGWHEVSVAFTAGESPVVRISVWRPRSRTFPMDINGRAWVGDLRLQAIQ